MNSLGRMMIVAGIVLLAAGILISYGDVLSHLRIRRLPGDIRIKRDNFEFYFPLTTCLAFSLIVSLILYLLRK
jgi:hypothetical protein